MFFQEPDETIKHNDDDIEESDDDADDALLEDVINLARQTNPRYNFYQRVYYFYKKIHFQSNPPYMQSVVMKPCNIS